MQVPEPLVISLAICAIICLGAAIVLDIIYGKD